MNKLFIIFGIVLVIFAGAVFYQFRSRTNARTESKQTVAANTTAKINNQTFKVDVADESNEWQRGLSGRESLDEDAGMLFLFKATDYHNFWMKDMKFPIDIIYIKGDTVVSIVKNAKPPTSKNDNLPLYKPEQPIDKVLEINAGLSDKYKIKKGDKIEIKTTSK